MCLAGIIADGFEWQARAWADAAQAEAQAPQVKPDIQSYAQGFSDAITYLMGEMTDAETPNVVSRIRERFHQSL